MWDSCHEKVFILRDLKYNKQGNNLKSTVAWNQCKISRAKTDSKINSFHRPKVNHNIVLEFLKTPHERVQCIFLVSFFLIIMRTFLLLGRKFISWVGLQDSKQVCVHMKNACAYRDYFLFKVTQSRKSVSGKQ